MPHSDTPVIAFQDLPPEIIDSKLEDHGTVMFKQVTSNKTLSSLLQIKDENPMCVKWGITHGPIQTHLIIFHYR